MKECVVCSLELQFAEERELKDLLLEMLLERLLVLENGEKNGR